MTTSVTNRVGEVIATIGSDQQQCSWLPPLCDGSFPADSFCLTKPGADTHRDGDSWVLDGRKIYVTSPA